MNKFIVRHVCNSYIFIWNFHSIMFDLCKLYSLTRKEEILENKYLSCEIFFCFFFIIRLKIYWCIYIHTYIKCWILLHIPNIYVYPYWVSHIRKYMHQYICHIFIVEMLLVLPSETVQYIGNFKTESKRLSINASVGINNNHNIHSLSLSLSLYIYIYVHTHTQLNTLMCV